MLMNGVNPMPKAKKQTLNEEQVAQGKKEAGMLEHPIFAVSPKYDPLIKRKEGEPEPPQRLDFVEAEKWYDARAFAIRFYGTAEVNIRPVGDAAPHEKGVLPRWQLRWIGNGASGTLAMQARLIDRHPDSVPPGQGWHALDKLRG